MSTFKGTCKAHDVATDDGALFTLHIKTEHTPRRMPAKPSGRPRKWTAPKPGNGEWTPAEWAPGYAFQANGQHWQVWCATGRLTVYAISFTTGKGAYFTYSSDGVNDTWTTTMPAAA